MARTRTLLNTERGAEAKLYLQRCGSLERQAHYAVRDILYHRLTFIMLNLPQTTSSPQPAPQNAKQHPPPSLSPCHCHSHICRQRLMGMEHCVTVLPCIKKTRSWKVQDKWCLPGDTLTTCQSDSPLLRSGSRELCWSVCVFLCVVVVGP